MRGLTIDVRHRFAGCWRGGIFPGRCPDAGPRHRRQHGDLQRAPRLVAAAVPFADADRLVRITSTRGGEDGFLNVPEQDDILALTHIVEDLALYTDQGRYNASGFGAPEELSPPSLRTTCFACSGVSPLMGSTFPPMPIDPAASRF